MDRDMPTAPPHSTAQPVLNASYLVPIGRPRLIIALPRCLAVLAVAHVQQSRVHVFGVDLSVQRVVSRLFAPHDVLENATHAH
jgi:hypothetical protein